MVASKSDLFDADLQKKANLFKALSHPARLQILQYLAQTRKCLTGDISEHFPLSRGTVNQHMNELKIAGLVVGHMEGAKVVYCLNPERINELRDVLGDLRKEIELPEGFSCCL